MSPPERSGDVVVLCTRSVHEALRAVPAALTVDRLGGTGGIEFVFDEEVAEADDFRATEMLSRLQPKIACRVEVIGDGRSLEDVERWIDSFRARIQHGLAETRSNEFRLVLVLCWLEPASQEDLGRLKAFTRDQGGLAVTIRDTRLVRRIYALDGRLNDAPGIGSGLFSARDCWPAAVDRLLVRLRMSTFSSRLSGTDRQLQAWRFAEIAAPWTVPACEAIRREVWRRHWLAKVEEWPPPIYLGATPDPPPLERPTVELPRFTDAARTSFRERVETTLTGSSRLQSQLESATEGVGAMWPLESASRRASARIWIDVRRRRERLELLANAKPSPRGGRNELARGQIEWIGRYLGESDRFERTSADLEEAADELDLARQTWVGWPLRAAGAIAIALVIAYAVYGLVRPVSGSALLALGSTTFIVAAIATAAGAVAGAMIPWWIERLCGNRAQRELQAHADDGAKSLHELAEALRRGVADASRLRLATWEENLAARLRRLGGRGSRLRILASEAASPASFEPGGRVQTAVTASRVLLPPESFDGIDAEEFVDVGESRLGEHLQESWAEMLGDEDRWEEGLLTTRAVPMLSRAMLDARRTAERAVAQKLFDDRFNGMDSRGPLIEVLRRRLAWMGEPRRPLLSVRLGVTKGGSDYHDRIATETCAVVLESDSLRTLLRESWPDGPEDPIATSAPWPSDSPVEAVGLFVEECVVAVEEVSDADLEEGDLTRDRPQSSRLKWILGEDERRQ